MDPCKPWTATVLAEFEREIFETSNTEIALIFSIKCGESKRSTWAIRKKDLV